MTENNTEVVVIGAKLKEFVCRGIVRHLADEARKPGAYSLHRISGGAKRQQLLQATAEQPARATQGETA